MYSVKMYIAGKYNILALTPCVQSNAESFSCQPTAAALLPKAPRAKNVCNYVTYTEKENVLVYFSK